MSGSTVEQRGIWSHSVSRRELLRQIAIGSGAAGIGWVSSQLLSEKNFLGEMLQQYPSRIISGDFGVTSWWLEQRSHVSQPYSPDNDHLLERLAGPHYAGTAWLALQSVRPSVRDVVDSGSGYVSMVEDMIDRSLHTHPVSTLLHLMLHKFSRHAGELSMHKRNVLRAVGLHTEPTYVVPVQRHVHPVVADTGAHIWRNREGMVGTKVRLDGRQFTTDVRRFGQSKNILVFPLQPGVSGLYYDDEFVPTDDMSLYESLMGKVCMEGAYAPERAYESLSELSDMVKQTSLLTIGALGNTPYDYTVDAVDQLQSEGRWVDDLTILAGEVLLRPVSYLDDLGIEREKWEYKSWYGSYGGPNDTIFVDNDTIGQEYMTHASSADKIVYGSSAASWTIGLYADLLMAAGVPYCKVKKEMHAALPIMQDIEGRDMRVLRNLEPLKDVVLAMRRS